MAAPLNPSQPVRRRRLLAWTAALAILLWAGWRAAPRPGPAAPADAALPAWPPLPQLHDAVRATAGKSPDIVLICIDTLRADHVGAYGYRRATTPRIDAFAAGARVHTRAYATTPFTTPSVVSMLTGVYPYRHRVRLLWQPMPEDVVTVPDWLRAAGYQTAAIVSNLVLSQEACGLGARFDHYDDAVDEPEPNRPRMLERRAARTTDAAINWLTTRRDAARPFFMWVHYIDPHGPYLPPEDAPRSFTHERPHPIDPEKVAAYARMSATTDGNDYVDAYDAEIAYADREVGRLLDALDAAGLMEQAVIILTADHGEFLLEREDRYFCHGFSVDECVVHVPLIVRRPGMAAGRRAEPVSVADIAPTVLAAAGLRPPDGLDGANLAGRRADPPYVEGPDPQGSGGLERAYVFSQRKAVLRHGRSHTPRASWEIDLSTSTGQPMRRGLDARDPAYQALVRLVRGDRTAGAAAGASEGAAPPSRIVADNLDADTLSRLRGLGYIE